MFGTGSVPVMTDGLMAGASDQFFREECTWYAPDGSEYHGPVSEAYDDEGNFLYAWADFYGEDDQGNSGGTEEEPWSDGVYQNPPEYEVTLGCERFPLNVKDEGGYWGVYDEEWKLVMTFGAGDNTCGMQVDPFWEWDQGEPDPKPYQVWVHVENDALQNANYHLAMEAKFINWNEFAEFNSCAD